MSLMEKKMRKINNVNKLSLEELERFRAINSISNGCDKKEIIYREFDADQIKLVVISDIHLGHKKCNKKKLLDIIQYVLEGDNTYCLLLGDQCECATKTSVGLGIYEEEMHLGEQLRWLAEKLKPLADAGKILGINIGNHEYRLAMFAEVDPAKLLADKLGVPYLGWQGYLTLKVKGIYYDISAFHGAGMGSSKASKINASKKIANITNCDLYLTGHTHDLLDDQTLKYEFDHENKCLVPVIKKFVVCGSFLEYWSSYPEMKGLDPAITGSPLITLDGSKKDIQIY